VKAAQKLLGVLTIGRGVPCRGWWWRELKEANKPLAGQNTQKKGRKQAVSHTSWLKNAVFCLKVLNPRSATATYTSPIKITFFEHIKSLVKIIAAT
jgi:hypothetical protein